MKCITTRGADNRVWILIAKSDQEPVIKGQDLLSRREGEGPYTLLGGTPPHKPSSTGRVHVRDENMNFREFFPTVFDLEWCHVDHIDVHALEHFKNILTP